MAHLGFETMWWGEVRAGAMPGVCQWDTDSKEKVIIMLEAGDIYSVWRVPLIVSWSIRAFWIGWGEKNLRERQRWATWDVESGSVLLGCRLLRAVVENED